LVNYALWGLSERPSGTAESNPHPTFPWILAKGEVVVAKEEVETGYWTLRTTWKVGALGFTLLTFDPSHSESYGGLQKWKNYYTN